ncbi:hypothetical protein BC830DRAFT_1175260, partial [Chytriomyces sp. MP71]
MRNPFDIEGSLKSASADGYNFSFGASVSPEQVSSTASKRPAISEGVILEGCAMDPVSSDGVAESTGENLDAFIQAAPCMQPSSAPVLDILCGNENVLLVPKKPRKTISATKLVKRENDATSRSNSRRPARNPSPTLTTSTSSVSPLTNSLLENIPVGNSSPENFSQHSSPSNLQAGPDNVLLNNSRLNVSSSTKLVPACPAIMKIDTTHPATQVSPKITVCEKDTAEDLRSLVTSESSESFQNVGSFTLDKEHDLPLVVPTVEQSSSVSSAVSSSTDIGPPSQLPNAKTHVIKRSSKHSIQILPKQVADFKAGSFDTLHQVQSPPSFSREGIFSPTSGVEVMQVKLQDLEGISNIPSLLEFSTRKEATVASILPRQESHTPVTASDMLAISQGGEWKQQPVYHIESSVNSEFVGNDSAGVDETVEVFKLKDLHDIDLSYRRLSKIWTNGQDHIPVDVVGPAVEPELLSSFMNAVPSISESAGEGHQHETLKASVNNVLESAPVTNTKSVDPLISPAAASMKSVFQRLFGAHKAESNERMSQLTPLPADMLATPEAVKLVIHEAPEETAEERTVRLSNSALQLKKVLTMIDSAMDDLAVEGVEWDSTSDFENKSLRTSPSISSLRTEGVALLRLDLNTEPTLIESSLSRLSAAPSTEIDTNITSIQPISETMAVLQPEHVEIASLAAIPAITTEHHTAQGSEIAAAIPSPLEDSSFLPSLSEVAVIKHPTRSTDLSRADDTNATDIAKSLAATFDSTTTVISGTANEVKAPIILQAPEPEKKECPPTHVAVSKSMSTNTSTTNIISAERIPNNDSDIVDSTSAIPTKRPIITLEETVVEAPSMVMDETSTPPVVVEEAPHPYQR